MCGISGEFAYDPLAPAVDREGLRRVRDAMLRRGPDGDGLWVSDDRRVGLAHRRLAIIDPSERGAQPMATAEGRLRITFNGEIYNYKSLRKELEARGACFRTGTDTEVLLHLYADRGERMVEVLRGMYAFALWDAPERRLFLARDPFGVKPLYLADDGRTLRFASQVKALVAGGQIGTRREPAGEVGFYLWGAVPEPYTVYSAVRSLPAGAHVTYRPNRAGTPRRFFSIREEMLKAEAEWAGGKGEVRGRIQEAFRDSVRHHLVADVPVGVFLSAGLDSTSMTAVAAEIEGSELRTLTLGFSEYQGTPQDETPLAAEVARIYGTRHETHIVSRQDFEEALPEILEAMDQPSTDGVNTYFVARCARKAGLKVALSGLGGDELLGGYPSFDQIPRLVAGLRGFRGAPRLGRTLRRLTSPWIGALASPKLAGTLEYGTGFAGAYLLRRALFMPWELTRVLAPETLRAGLEELETIPRLNQSIGELKHPTQRVAALELEWYMRNQLLRDADWAGMAHSVEIRVPFVDVGFFRAVAPALAKDQPPGKQSTAGAPRQPLPPALLARPKTGFATPVRDWIEQSGTAARGPRGLRGWARAVYPPSEASRILALVTDAFGGHGGIALYGRDLLQALCTSGPQRYVTAVPRLAQNPLSQLPEGLRYVTQGVNGKWRFATTVLRLLLAESGQYDLVICGHINLLPVAFLASAITRAPLALVVYGIEAWPRVRSPLSWVALRKTKRVVSISALTLDRFLVWSRFDRKRTTVLPNAIHLDWYSPGPKSPALLGRYGLGGRQVLMTLGRMVSAERYKGFDEVLEVLPALIPEYPDLSYLMVGDGSDEARLRRKAADLGLSDRVVFAGRIGDDEKADHYRLADAFVLPSQGEGFGFVLLEAMACGIPVVASSLDGGKEAVRGGLLGVLIDPTDREGVARGIREALARPKGVPQGLDYFSFDRFRERVDAFVDEALR